MNEAGVAYEIELYRWRTVVMTLSLDVAAPYFPAMGLMLPRGFREGIRQVITRLRGEGVDPEISAAYALEVLRWSDKAYGHAFADSLYWWGRTIFQSGVMSTVERSLMIWDDVMRTQDFSWRKEPLPQPALVARLRELLMADQRESVFRLRPSTEWDVELYAWLEYDRFYTPMDSVEQTRNCYALLHAWWIARREVPGEAELAAAEPWVAEVAHGQRVRLDEVGDPRLWPSLTQSF